MLWGKSNARLALPALHAGLLFLVLPWLPQPFSLPKLALLAAGAAGLGLLALKTRAAAATAASPPALPFALGCAWLSLASISALINPGSSPTVLLLDGAAAVLFLSLLVLRTEPGQLEDLLATLGGVLAAIVLAQSVFAGPRLRLFGTLGNPDFCAAWLIAAACLAAARRRFALLGLHAAALAVLGSFATLLSLAAAGLVLALVLRRGRPAVAAALAICALAATSGRDPLRALAGRVYLHRVALPHLADAPFFGSGPGSVRARWPAWEAARPVARGEEAFAAPQDHVHDDWLERALEQGLPAALVLATLAALALAAAIRRGDPRLAGPAAAVASLAARAFVDFPLARPAELALFVTLLALCLLPEESRCPESS